MKEKNTERSQKEKAEKWDEFFDLIRIYYPTLLHFNQLISKVACNGYRDDNLADNEKELYICDIAFLNYVSNLVYKDTQQVIS